MANGTNASGQLIGLSNTDSFNTFYINSDSTSPQDVEKSVGGYTIAADTALGITFEIRSDRTAPYPALYIGKLGDPNSTPVRSTTFSNYYDSTKSDINSTSTGTSISIDTTAHKIYIPIGSVNTSENGMLVSTYSVAADGTVSITTPQYIENSAGNMPPSYGNSGGAFDARTGNIYFDNVDSNQVGVGDENGIFKIATVGGNQAPVSILDSSGLGQIAGLALDRPDDRLYFATRHVNSSGSTYDSSTLYMLNSPDTATASTKPTQLTFAAGVAQPKLYLVTGVAYDENAHVLYVANVHDTSSGQTIDYSDSSIIKYQLDSTGTVIIGTSTIPYSAFTSQRADAAPFAGLTFAPLSTLTLSGTATAAMSTGTPVTLLTGTPNIVDYGSGGYLASASVSIRTTGNAVASGDRLGLVQNGTFTAFTSTATQYIDHGHTFLVSYANGTLTIANKVGSAFENTIGAYQQILADVQYMDGSSDFSDRTVTVQVNNGAVGNPYGPYNSKSFTLDVVPENPTIKAGGFQTTDIEGQTATGASGDALAGDSDPNGGTLSITKLGNQAIAAGGHATVTGTYGTLTLNSDGSYSYVADNTGSIDGAATGARPTDSFTFTVTTSEGSSANETFNVTIDRAPDIGGDGTTVSFTKGDPAVTVDDGLTVADRDGDTIAGATATIAGVQAGDALGLTADAVAAAGDAGIAVSYGNGTVTLSGSASAATYQSVLQGLTYSNSSDDPTAGGTDTTRTIQVSVSDGTTSSTVASNTVDVFDTNTTEVSYTNGTVYDPTNSTSVTVNAFTGLGTSYTVVVTSSAQGTMLSIDNGSRTQNIAFNQSQVAFKLDYSDNTGAVSLTGGDYGDTLIGGSGDDTLVGGAGNDMLSGGLGTNSIDGGADTNTVSYADYTGGGGVTIDLSDTTGSANATAAGLSDTLTNIENVIGSDGDDTIHGSAGRNVLEGGGGADRLIGGSRDFASYAHAANGVHADLSGLTTNTNDAAGDTYVGIENLYGSQFDDTLIGDSNNNIISGLGGADTIDGGLGNDTIRLSTNPTKIDGGGGTDTLVIGAGAGISLTDDNLTGIERVIVFGGATLDMAGVTSDVPSLIRSYSKSGETTDITGTAGADRIFAGKGNDILSGGSGGSNGTTDGNDVFFAGSGSDTFNELMAGFGRDVIYNANLSRDTFDVAGLATDASHLHFAIINNGADTLVYGDAGQNGDALVLKGITAADNAQANGHFTFTPAST